MSYFLAQLLGDGGFISLPVALIAGVIAGVNPCCLPIYPTAVGTCAALRRDTVRANLGIAATFVVGVSFASTTLGIVSGLAGHMFMGLGSWPAYAIAALPIVFGLHLLGTIRVPLPTETRLTPKIEGVAGALIAGSLIGLIVTPCSTPVLAGLLAYVASTGNPVWGGLLLFAYGLGLGVPVLLLGTAAASLMTRLSTTRVRLWAERASGVMLIGVGLYLMWIA
ncbi:MAG: cytochrome c biogenesis CcdA family protein [Thermoanaerobaculales bacterium]